MPCLMLPFSILITYTFIRKSAALFSLANATHSSWILCVFVCLCIAFSSPRYLVRLCGIFGKTSRIYRSLLYTLSLSLTLRSSGCRSFLCLSIKWSRINSMCCCCFLLLLLLLLFRSGVRCVVNQHYMRIKWENIVKVKETMAPKSYL